MEPMTDGCTGFQWAEWLFPKITACCTIHDTGGTDGTLLDCLQTSVPEWAWPFAAASVAVMVLFRPVYNWLKRKRHP
jgi:hypothetical protein